MTEQFFCGNKVSDYGIKHKRVDYATFAESFSLLFIPNVDYENLTPIRYDEEDEIFQYYYVDEMGKRFVENLTNDPLFYDERNGLYVWGITHWGTSWNYVLTDIVLEEYDE